jgi:hypothetical protein
MGKGKAMAVPLGLLLVGQGHHQTTTSASLLLGDNGQTNICKRLVCTLG